MFRLSDSDFLFSRLYYRKHCVQSYNVFDFLRDIVSRVPDYGHGHSSDAAGEERTISRRRFERLFPLVPFIFVHIIPLVLHHYRT